MNVDNNQIRILKSMYPILLMGRSPAIFVAEIYEMKNARGVAL
jgi:hypothetical protein